MDLRMGAGRRKRRGRQRKEHMFESFFRFCCCACLATSVALSAPPQRAKEPVDYVDPYIGSIGHLLTPTSTRVQYPYGMVRLAPATSARNGDRYFAHDISGFPAGAATLMATTGALETDLAKCGSSFDHDQETATPYYWSAILEHYGIEAEATVTEHAAYYRFTFPTNAHSHLLIRDNGEFEVVGPAAVAGQSGSGAGGSGGGRGGIATYFYAEFSKPLGEYSTWEGATIAHESKRSGANIGLISDGATTKGEKIRVRIGISNIGIEQAHKNLQKEIPEWGQDRHHGRNRKATHDLLYGTLSLPGPHDQLHRGRQILQRLRQTGARRRRPRLLRGRRPVGHLPLAASSATDPGPEAAAGHGPLLCPDVRTKRLAAFVPVNRRGPGSHDRPPFGGPDCRHLREGLPGF